MRSVLAKQLERLPVELLRSCCRVGRWRMRPGAGGGVTQGGASRGGGTETAAQSSRARPCFIFTRRVLSAVGAQEVAVPQDGCISHSTCTYWMSSCKVFSACAYTLMTEVIWLLDIMSLLLATTPLLPSRLSVVCKRPLGEGCRNPTGRTPGVWSSRLQWPARSKACVFLLV